MAAKKKTVRRRPAAKRTTRKSTKGKRHYEGPREWLMPMMEQAYARLVPKEEAERAPPAPRRRPRAGAFASSFRADTGEEALSPVKPEHWVERLREYQSRKRRAVQRGAAVALGAPPAPAVAGVTNWVPLGPSVVARGQAQGRPAISGRVAGIAIAPGGLRAYVAAAIGGVWRSDNGGLSWSSTMDGFDTNPTAFAAASLVCGAIAIDPADPDRIYVGTGEGDTDALFNSRLTSSLPSYRGIGPIRSDDGGQNWVTEPSAPSLAGFAFFQIAVDPVDREHCVAATTNGLYERVPAGGGFQWTRRRTGIHASVIVTRSGTTTTWIAGTFAGAVVSSANGTSWSTLGTGLPAGAGRVALAAQPDNPNVVYALIASTGGALNSVRRLDGGAGSWKNVSGPPALLPGGQGDYDLCIAVDPNNANRIYLGGDYFNDGSIYPGSVWRADVSASGTAWSMSNSYIGGGAHADVHVLAHTPGTSNRLWCGTDGGVFLNQDPGGSGGFESRNTGLATLACNYFAQHPTEPAVLYTGMQDNGTAKGTGEMVWRHVLFADGGYCVVNWADPFRVLLYANGSVYRATDGGLDWTSWTNVTPPVGWLLMAEPLVGAPYNPGSPGEADIVALGAGSTVYISSNFGTSWPDTVTLPAGSGFVYSMIFASPTRIFAGTTNGRVFRIDDGGAAGWTATRLDNAAGGALGLVGMVADVAVDWSDATRQSIYVCFGGVGDYRHVWRYDGTAWQARSGPAGGAASLIDVEHNAIQFDAVTGNVYVAADIGVWVSSNGGNAWNLLEQGLPDAPVFDLQIHPTLRLLRASLHGRGLWELKLDAPAQPDVELYVRDTMLDTGRGINTDGRDDPSIFPTAPVRHYLSPNIKVDVPTPLGYQTPGTDIDFFTFNETITDGSAGVATNTPPPTVHNRVYVEVHNRGRTDATDVKVMAAVTNASAGLGPLPAGYTANVVAGTSLPGTAWTTLGVATIPTLRAGFPRVVHFDLPSTALPLPASLPGQSHYCLVSFVHCAQDAFTGTQTNVDLLTLADRKVGQKNLHIVEFVGTPPSRGIGTWAMLDIHGLLGRRRLLADLVFDLRRFPGSITLVMPKALSPRDLRKNATGWRQLANTQVRRWAKVHGEAARRLYYEAKYPARAYEHLAQAMKLVATQRPLRAAGKAERAIHGIALGSKDAHSVFLRIDPPRGARAGMSWEFDVELRDSRKGTVYGGSRYRVVMNRAAKKPR